MNDSILQRFLTLQPGLIARLCFRSNGTVAYRPVGPAPWSAFLLRYALPYLAIGPGGAVESRPGPVVFGVRFPPDYLKSVDPALSMKVVSALTTDILHPNISDGVVCLGSDFAAGTSLDWLARQLHSVAAYENFTLDERVSLNPLACRLLRECPLIVEQLPRRSLIPRATRLAITVKEIG